MVNVTQFFRLRKEDSLYNTEKCFLCDNAICQCREFIDWRLFTFLNHNGDESIWLLVLLGNWMNVMPSWLLYVVDALKQIPGWHFRTDTSQFGDKWTTIQNLFVHKSKTECKSWKGCGKTTALTWTFFPEMEALIINNAGLMTNNWGSAPVVRIQSASKSSSKCSLSAKWDEFTCWY